MEIVMRVAGLLTVIFTVVASGTAEAQYQANSSSGTMNFNNPQSALVQTMINNPYKSHGGSGESSGPSPNAGYVPYRAPSNVPSNSNASANPAAGNAVQRVQAARRSKSRDVVKGVAAGVAAGVAVGIIGQALSGR
jgi:hypothetical protein